MLSHLSLYFFIFIFSLSCGQENYQGPSRTTAQSTAPTAISSPPPMGKINVNSWPEDAKVYIDNIYQGQTPLLIQSVPVGNYKLQLEKWDVKNPKDIIVEQDKDTQVFKILDLPTPQINRGGLIIENVLMDNTPVSSFDIYVDGPLVFNVSSYKNLNLEPSKRFLKLLVRHLGQDYVYYQYMDIVENETTYINNVRLLPINPQIQQMISENIDSSFSVTHTFQFPCLQREAAFRYRGFLNVCFSDNNRYLLRRAIDLLFHDPNKNYTPQSQFSSTYNTPWTPFPLAQDLVSLIESQPSNPQFWGKNVGNKHIILSDNLFHDKLSGNVEVGQALTELSATLIHEALHSITFNGRQLLHTCGPNSTQDPDGRGVHGTEARYKARLASLGNHPWLNHCLDRLFLYLGAEQRIESMICEENGKINLRNEFPFPSVCRLQSTFKNPKTIDLIQKYVQTR